MMASFAGLQFLRPYWLLALLALPPLLLWWRARRQRSSAWREVVDPHLLPHLLDTRAGADGAGGFLLATLAFALAVLALAGPSWRHGTQPLWQQTTPLVVAVDLSSATLANDLPPSRLLQARAKIEALLRQRAGGQIGLVAFADDAYTVAPLTADTANVALFLDALSPEVMPVDGSRPARAIAWSAQLLERAGFDSGDILLLTHAADAQAQRAAASAARAGYRVSVLGLGSAQGSTYRDTGGRILRTRLDAEGLRELARAGGGVYAAVASGDADLRALGVLDPDAVAGTARGARVGIRLDDGYWLLLPLLVLAALAFRRGGPAAAALLCLWLPLAPVTVRAQPQPQAQAQAIEGNLWRRDDQAAHARMRAGIDAFRQSDYAAAERAWRTLPGAEAAYNRGNALAKAGRYREAIAAYDAALAERPNMEDAIANRRAVEEAMRRRPPPGPRADAAGEPQTGQPPQSPGDGAPREDDPGEAGDPAEAGSPEAPPEQSPEAADDRAQEEADAAQRERMRREMEAREDGEEDAEAAADASETAQERERREANEAWLRRVPDDPGGLLRAKFRLEHERRRREGMR